MMLMAAVVKMVVRREEATSLTINVAVEVCAVEVEERQRYLPEVK